jgi:hypothetical protein
LPQNRTAAARENLKAALALTDDLIKNAKPGTTPAAALGRRGDSTTAQRFVRDHYRKMTARKTRAGGRPRKQD